MNPSKYNFRQQENKNRAVYKLVMFPKSNSKLRGTYTNSKGNKVIVIYGYYNKPDFGIHQLRILVQRYATKIESAYIYAKPGLNPNHKDFSNLFETFNF